MANIIDETLADITVEEKNPVWSLNPKEEDN